jgi:type IV secretory pathway VirB2 component (pilin)
MPSCDFDDFGKPGGCATIVAVIGLILVIAGAFLMALSTDNFWSWFCILTGGVLIMFIAPLCGSK